MSLSQMHLLNRVEFGPGAFKLLPESLAGSQIQRPLLILDPGLAALGFVGRVAALLGRDCATFAEVLPNPTEAAVLRALDAYRDAGCDGIIALGGGSPLDLAKAVALLATHAGPLERYAAIRGGSELIGPSAPVIAIPTTAGTGSEVGRGALITMASGDKLVVASRHLLPVVALCDPELTVSLPPLLTAATGMDALSHCIEAYLSPSFNPLIDAVLLDGAARAWRAMPAAVSTPGDLGARGDMMLASIAGGFGFQKGLGAVHALSHPLGALRTHSLHHGTCNAVIMPEVLRFNRPVAGERIAHLEAALGLADGQTLDRAIEAANVTLGLPRDLGSMGVTREMVPDLVQGALQDHSRPTNPRELTEGDVTALYGALLP